MTSETHVKKGTQPLGDNPQPAAAGSAGADPSARPILKWAGGKTQLVAELDRARPGQFVKYIEPFVGGGAYFFHVAAQNSVIADSNPDLINLYRAVAAAPHLVAKELAGMPTDKESFYRVRALDQTVLSQSEAAARTIFLNRLCFNGLYRVNKLGRFNVPYAGYKKPTLPSLAELQVASAALTKATIVCGDYKAILREYAAEGDFVFLDPPYLPMAKYSDFRRYTAQQFTDDDHVELAAEAQRLTQIGCALVVTHSNHPLVRELYPDFTIRVINTRRNINSKGSARKGQDLILTNEKALFGTTR